MYTFGGTQKSMKIQVDQKHQIDNIVVMRVNVNFETEMYLGTKKFDVKGE